jgi:PmbA protein
MNEIVMNEALDIIDNGVIPERFGSTPFDAEGVPTNKKTLIEKGVLKSLMHNSYTARRWGMKNSTGNAIRNERGISVGPTNLYIESNLPQSSFDDLLKFIDKGIYILEVMGMHTANPVSGDFSVGIAGVYIEKGELKYPVKEAIISGNVSQIFKNIKALGQDLTFYRNIGTPTLLVEGIDISG